MQQAVPSLCCDIYNNILQKKFDVVTQRETFVSKSTKCLQIEQTSVAVTIVHYLITTQLSITSATQQATSVDKETETRRASLQQRSIVLYTMVKVHKRKVRKWMQ